MNKIVTAIYWLSYLGYVYEFGYASLWKVFQVPKMMQGMEAFGFNKTWTLTIGYAELAGLFLLLAGLVKPELRTIGVLFLFPFAIGAFTAHMAHGEYHHYYASLLMCILSVVLLCTDKHFKMTIG